MTTTKDRRKDGKPFVRFDMLPSRSGSKAQARELLSLLSAKGGRPWRLADAVSQAVANELERVKAQEGAA